MTIDPKNSYLCAITNQCRKKRASIKVEDNKQPIDTELSNRLGLLF